MCLEAARSEPQLAQDISNIFSPPLFQGPPPCLGLQNVPSQVVAVPAQPVCLPSLPWGPSQGSMTIPRVLSAPPAWGVPMRPSLEQFFTTRFYFSFLLTKNIEELYIVGGQLGSPFGSKRARYVTTSRPRAWGMKAEHLPPTLPQPQETPAPHRGGSAIQGLPGGQEGGAGTASLRGQRGSVCQGCRTHHSPPKRSAGL